MPITIIAEIGNNHCGDLALAKRMADAAVAAGADLVKFQVYDLAGFIAPGNPYHGDFQRESLPFAAFADLKAHVEAAGARFLATPFDLASLEFLDGLGCDAVKIASGDVDNFDLLGRAAALGKRLILSVGGATAAEIDHTVAFLRQQGADFTLLHCVLAYPATFAEANLRSIPALRQRYGIEVGYSDHTPGVEASVAAVALGATIVEKHFTTDRALPGGDNEMSILPEELARLRHECDNVALALGSAEHGLSATEQTIRRLVRRSCHAARDLAAGTPLAEADLVLLRPAAPGIGFTAGERASLLGRRLARAVAKGEAITGEDLGRDG